MKLTEPLTPEEIAHFRACPGMTIRNAWRIYGFAKNKIYDLMSEGRITFTKVGHQTVLATGSLEALVAPTPGATVDPKGGKNPPRSRA
jgi:hypothetical protein